jgi:hypothetical protein
VDQAIADGLRTADIATAGVKPVGTREMADAVIDGIKALHGAESKNGQAAVSRSSGKK